MRNFFISLFLIFAYSLSFASDNIKEQLIIQRIKPIGQVYIEGDSSQVPVPVEVKPKKLKLSTQEIYQKSCAICHASGLANAPKFEDQKDWEPRLVKGMDVLLKNVVDGFNAMPAKGTCMDCSDEELKQAILYMLPKKP